MTVRSLVIGTRGSTYVSPLQVRLVSCDLPRLRLCQRLLLYQLVIMTTDNYTSISQLWPHMAADLARSGTIAEVDS